MSTNKPNPDSVPEDDVPRELEESSVETQIESLSALLSSAYIFAFSVESFLEELDKATKYINSLPESDREVLNITEKRQSWVKKKLRELGVLGSKDDSMPARRMLKYYFETSAQKLRSEFTRAQIIEFARKNKIPLDEPNKKVSTARRHFTHTCYLLSKDGFAVAVYYRDDEEYMDPKLKIPAKTPKVFIIIDRVQLRFSDEITA